MRRPSGRDGKRSERTGSPLAAVAHLVALHAGEMVTTGTITTVRSVRAGETWQSEIGGIALPGLTIDFLE
jgi:2-oxo-3-hexenedioate decarboxylase